MVGLKFFSDTHRFFLKPQHFSRFFQEIPRSYHEVTSPACWIKHQLVIAIYKDGSHDIVTGFAAERYFALWQTIPALGITAVRALTRD